MICLHLALISPSERGISCCKQRGVPKLCAGFCAPGGASITGRRGIKCGRKYAQDMYYCKSCKYPLIDIHFVP